MWLLWGSGVAIALIATACSLMTSPEPLRQIQIQQNWAVKQGDRIANHPVVAGLGDISIQLNGDAAYAPFAGRVEPNSEFCVLYSTPEIPAYLFRLCGLSQLQLGEVSTGAMIGTGDYLHITTLRKQPDGTWTIVEPAKDILERILTPP
ncbi:hypothetical protein IFO70_12270 [Phormidium tenue FACHB-886]|nr:hypothetical protein [Phormidium tenue FACHB-886]